MRRITTRRWWTLIAATATMLLATTASMAGAATSLAAIPPRSSCAFATDMPLYKGWATMSFRGCPSDGGVVTDDCKGGTAYRWTNRGWVARGIGECGTGPSQVYVWPFASGWSWIWSQQTGWLAVESRYVLIASAQADGPHTGH